MLGDGPSSTLLQAIKDDVLVKDGNTFTCMVCKISMTGIVPADSHLIGAKHKKAVQMSKMDMAVAKNYDCTDSSSNAGSPTNTDTYIINQPDLKQLITSTEIEAAIKSGEVTFTRLGSEGVLTCVPCNKSCTGKVPMIQHLGSEVHAKMKRKEAFMFSPTASNTPTVNSSLPEDKPLMQDLEAGMRSGRVVSKNVGNSVILLCVPCNKSCSGEVPMKQHLNSEVHAKRIRLERKEELLFQNTNSSCNSGVTEATHTVKWSNAMRGGIIKPVESDGSHFHCVVCKVNCTGKDSMIEHLQGKNHLKMQKAKENCESFMQSVTTPKPETRDTNFPTGISTLDQSDFSIVIPPPPEFKDCTNVNSSVTKKNYNEVGGRFLNDTTPVYPAATLNLPSNRKPSLSKMMKYLPDIRVYSPRDSLHDLFN